MRTDVEDEISPDWRTHYERILGRESLDELYVNNFLVECKTSVYTVQWPWGILNFSDCIYSFMTFGSGSRTAKDINDCMEMVTWEYLKNIQVPNGKTKEEKHKKNVDPPPEN